MTTRVTAGHRSFGSDNGSAKLTANEVKAMRRLHGEKGLTVQDIADVFSMSRRHVSDIINKKYWAHV